MIEEIAMGQDKGLPIRTSANDECGLLPRLAWERGFQVSCFVLFSVCLLLLWGKTSLRCQHLVPSR